MNFRVLAASAQAPQRSNGNDFPPHNAPRPKREEEEEGEGGERAGGLGRREGALFFKGRLGWGGAAVRSTRGSFCVFEKAAPFFHALLFLLTRLVSFGHTMPPRVPRSSPTPRGVTIFSIILQGIHNLVRFPFNFYSS